MKEFRSKTATRPLGGAFVVNSGSHGPLTVSAESTVYRCPGADRTSKLKKNPFHAELVRIRALPADPLVTSVNRVKVERKAAVTWDVPKLLVLAR